ncbi:hypothetical protein [Roseimarinus sediminis]|uniref:hypothetical protein n=1 Tax=Roseimarinus sediminis TaxID=1610899 RepID=UPI003D255D40
MNKEIEPKFKHFALAMLIILSLISPFFIIGGRNASRCNNYLKNNGKEVIAFYAYPAGRMSSRVYKFEYKVNGKRFTAALNKPFELSPNYPFKEIPIMVRYAEEKPGRSIVLPDKEFNYKGFQIKWITHDESRYYYMTIKKVD